MHNKLRFSLLITSLFVGLSASAQPIKNNIRCYLTGSTEQRVVKEESSRPTIALALGGGGVRGAAHIGVLRAFEKAHIKIDFIAGTSMGAMVGGMYAAGVPLDKIEQLMLSRTGLISAMVPTFPLPIAAGVPVVAARIFGVKHSVGLVNGNAIARLVDKTLPEGQRQIEDLKLPFVAVASNVIDGKAYTITKGDMGKALQASASVPMLFEPVGTEDGKLLIDGGLRANIPTRQARASRADIVIAVNVDDNLRNLSLAEASTIHGLSNRALSMMLAEIDEHQLENSDIEISPSTNTISIYSRSRKDAARAIAAGELATTEKMPNIRAKIYSHMNGASHLSTDVKTPY
jgi:NTE family protein